MKKAIANILAKLNKLLKPKNENQSIAAYIAGLFAVPFSLYILMVIFAGITNMTFIMALAVCGGLVSLFLLGRIFYIWNNGQLVPIRGGKAYYLLTVVLGLALPITGLMLNSSLGFGNAGLFGDFSSPAFYIIAILNGLLLLIPVPENNNLRLLLFFLKSAGYTYILYFFAVFIPVMPLGFFLLPILLGIYAFAPLLIAIWQGKILFDEYRDMKIYFGRVKIIAVFLAGLIVLPFILTAGAHNDRPNIEKAVKYLDNSGNDEVDISALKRSLKFIGGAYGFTSTRMDFFETGFVEGSIPIISNLYKEYVLHNQVLSADNIALLRSIFFDEPIPDRTQSDNGRIRTVELKSAVADTVFDADMDAYKTWLHLELENFGGNNAEFVTEFELPEGVYVSDYYLNVNGRKKYGLLTDERAAVFIYNRIVSKSLDPGLLHYIDDNALELRVFPFAESELRQTGIELIHKQKFDLNIGGKIVAVNGDDTFNEVSYGGVTLLSAETIAGLPDLNRTPEYNFVIDCSKGSNVRELEKRTTEYMTRENIAEANIYFASYRASREKLKDEGGFNFRHAAKTIFNETSEDKYPVIIAVTDDFASAVLPTFENAYLFPETDGYFVLGRELWEAWYTFDNRPSSGLPAAAEAVLYRGMAVKNNGQNQIVITGSIPSELSQNRYENAVMLHAAHNTTSTAHIRNSFKAKILTRGTAFIVVETEQQEKDLMALQEKLLNNTADTIQDSQPLSEPPIYIFVIVMILALLIIRLRSDTESD